MFEDKNAALRGGFFVSVREGVSWLQDVSPYLKADNRIATLVRDLGVS